MNQEYTVVLKEKNTKGQIDLDASNLMLKLAKIYIPYTGLEYFQHKITVSVSMW